MKIQNRNIRLNLGIGQHKKSNSQSNAQNNSMRVHSSSEKNLKKKNNLINISGEDFTNLDINPKMMTNTLDTDIEDDERVKQEAKALIEKTRNMMKELSTNASYSLNKKNNKKNYECPNNNFRCLSKEKNYNFDLCDISSTNNKNNLPQQLFSKNKQIKQLEKELKDKTQQLKIAQQKIQSKNDEIIKLNEALTLERANNLKAENIKLQRKIFSLEKANEENKKTYEKLIEELKSKLTKANNNISLNEQKISALEKFNNELSNDKNSLHIQINDNNNNIQQMKEKLEIENKVNENKELALQDLRLKLSNLCAIIKSLFNKENNFYKQRESFLENLNNIFDTPFHAGSMSDKNQNASLMGSTNGSDFVGYNRKEMNNTNVIFSKKLNFDYNSLNTNTNNNIHDYNSY